MTSFHDVFGFGHDTKLASRTPVAAIKPDGVVRRNVLISKVSQGTVLTKFCVLLVRKVTNRTDVALVRRVSTG